MMKMLCITTIERATAASSVQILEMSQPRNQRDSIQHHCRDSHFARTAQRATNWVPHASMLLATAPAEISRANQFPEPES